MEAISHLSTMQPSDLDVALERLAQAFDFTVVDRCPAPECEVCGRDRLPAAA